MDSSEVVSSYKELMGTPQDVIDHPDHSEGMKKDFIRGMQTSTDIDNDMKVPRGDGGRSMSERIRLSK